MGLPNYSSHSGQDVWKAVIDFFKNSQPNCFLPAIGQHAIYVESRSPDPFNKYYLGISHIWARPITAVTLANTFERL